MSNPQNSKAVGTNNTLSDVYKVLGYSRKAGVKAIQRLVPDKHKMRLGDVEIDLLGTPSQTQFCWKNPASIASGTEVSREAYLNF